jgi:hypothetical protein
MFQSLWAGRGRYLVEIEVSAALTREIAVDPRKRAGDSFDNFKVIYISRQEPM